LGEVTDSSYYSKVIENIKNNRQRRLEGKINCIPWNSFPKLSSKIPGIEKEQYVIVTANSKVSGRKYFKINLLFQLYIIIFVYGKTYKDNRYI
jgi:hypothetical protein